MHVFINKILYWIVHVLIMSCIISGHKVSRTTVREIKPAMAMAENDIPVSISRLSMEVELEEEGEELSMILEQNHVLLDQSNPTETFIGRIVDKNGDDVGDCAITFTDKTRKTYSGLLSTIVDGEKSLIQTITNEEVDEMKHKPGIHCGSHFHDHGAVSLQFGRPEPLFDLFSKKSSLVEETEADDFKCFPERHYLYLGVAADCEFVKRSGGHAKSKELITKTFNEVSMMYQKAFNVAIGIIEMLVPTDEECASEEYMLNAPSWNSPCMPASKLSPKLAEFTKWRIKERSNDEAGLWHLLTGCPVDGSEVGLGWIDTLGVRSVKGRHQRSIGGTAVSTLEGGNPTKVVAHEIGHNLGASHDCSKHCSCVGITCRECCPCSSDSSNCDCRGQYLMNPTTNMASLNFSPCTRRQICASLKLRPNHVHHESAALTRVHPQGAICGNGVKEDGEECDCGSPEECAKDPCCQQGCRLRPTAECSDRHGGGCCQKCKIVRNTKTKCRPSRSFCDYDEYCTGTHGECPPDRFKPDGSDCPDGHCASGVCTSRDAQCRTGAARFHALSYCPSLSLRSACQLHCRVPGGLNAGDGEECLQLASMLIDGTRCGERGLCRQGVCVEGGVVGRRPMRYTVLLFIPIVIVFSLTIYLYKRFQ